MNFRKPFFRVAVILLIWPVLSQADVCSWRDPDRTMARLFPKAQDYSTIYKKVDVVTVKKMEEALDAPLDPSEKQEFSFYPITGPKGESLGTAMALAGKGEYGAIEVLIGVDPSGKIVGVYIQRSRERVSKSLRDDSFLSQFLRKDRADPLRIGEDIKAPPGAEKASAVVAFAIKKMLLFYEHMMTSEVTP